jgi:hypothetical protein
MKTEYTNRRLKDMIKEMAQELLLVQQKREKFETRIAKTKTQKWYLFSFIKKIFSRKLDSFQEKLAMQEGRIKNLIYFQETLLSYMAQEEPSSKSMLVSIMSILLALVWAEISPVYTKRQRQLIRKLRENLYLVCREFASST